MHVRSKICGITTPETLDAALKGGASHIGFVFFAKSPRNLSVDKAATLASRVQGRAKIVGLFVDPTSDDIEQVRSKVPIDVIQLHGDEEPATVARMAVSSGLELWKALPIRTARDLEAAQAYQGDRKSVV